MLSRGRVEQCSRQMTVIATRNGRKVPEAMDENLKSIATSHSSEKNYGALQLCQYPVVRMRTVLVAAC